jgi:hypothetical protein
VPEQQQRQWEFERQWWQLLPTVLLPLASSLLLPGAPHPPGLHVEGAVQDLLRQRESALSLSAELHRRLGTLGTPPAAPPVAWFEELLDVLVRLTDQLLCQPPVSVTLGPTASSSSSTSPSTSRMAAEQETRSACAAHLLVLLVTVAQKSQASAVGPSSTNNCNSLAGGVVPSGLRPLSQRFVQFVSAVETALRAVAVAVHSGTLSNSKEGLVLTGGNKCLATLQSVLLPCSGQSESLLMQHMGFRGPAALAQEQQQMYSLLRAARKLRCCAWAADGNMQEQIASGCLLAAARAAVGLLKVASAAGAGGLAATEQQVQSLAAAAAVPSLSYLPSLVIFTCCLLHWTLQLQEQSPELLLLGSAQ